MSRCCATFWSNLAFSALFARFTAGAVDMVIALHCIEYLHRKYCPAMAQCMNTRMITVASGIATLSVISYLTIPRILYVFLVR